jgi:hypothetical protein
MEHSVVLSEDTSWIILEFLHAYRQTSPETAFIKVGDVIKHAHRIMGNGVLVITPHDWASVILVLPIVGN